MIIICKKEINLKKATAYLVFEKETKREDIRNFLSGNEFDNEMINERVTEYLKKSGILDQNGYCTKKGNRIKQTGKMFEREEGKYNIWYTENDCFSGTTIFYFERVEPYNYDKPYNYEQIEDLSAQFEPYHFLLPVGSDASSEVQLIGNNEPIYGTSHSKTENIRLQWTWNDLESSTIIFTGKLKNKKINKKEIILNEKSHINTVFRKYTDLKHCIQTMLFQDWSQDNQRLRIQFDTLKSNHAKISFLIDKEIKYPSCFDSVICRDIPLMPYDQDDANSWRDWLLEDELSRKYFSKYAFEKRARELNKKKGFSAYFNDLAIPDVKEQQEKLYVNRAKQNSAYWHLTAPLDLNPDSFQEYSKQSLHFEVNRRISFNQIAEEIMENTNHPINAIIYYDKYVIKENQQKAMKAFFDCFDDCQLKSLITDVSLQKNNFLKDNAPSIKQYSLMEAFGPEKPQHDRYLILCENKKNWTVWQMPSSIDFIKFNETIIKPDSNGTLIDSFSYTNVRKEMLKTQFINFIEAII